MGSMGDQQVGDRDILYVPAHPITTGGRKDVGFELRQLESGEKAAIAFTSLPRLVEALGNSQPWLAMPMARLRDLMGSRGVAQVAVDPTVPSGAWRWNADDVRGMSQRRKR
jgi:hypothetical protein